MAAFGEFSFFQNQLVDCVACRCRRFPHDWAVMRTQNEVIFQFCSGIGLLSAAGPATTIPVDRTRPTPAERMRMRGGWQQQQQPATPWRPSFLSSFRRRRLIELGGCNSKPPRIPGSYAADAALSFVTSPERGSVFFIDASQFLFKKSRGNGTDVENEQQPTAGLHVCFCI
jgi:hypothetical protein